MDGQQLADTIMTSIFLICGAAVLCVFIWKILD